VPTLYLHIGTRKSGTTFVQRALRASAPALAEQGLALVFPNRRSEVKAVLTPLRRHAAGGDAAEARAAVEAMVDGILASPLERHLVTLEDLGTLPGTTADLYHSALERLDVELLVTARHWGATLPSEWQQRVKQGAVTSYADFLTAVRGRTPASADFLRCQDVPAMVRRWRGGLPDEKVHVLAVPPRTATPGLLDLFCGVLGVDPDRLTVPELPQRALNTSLGMAEAETLRRVNLALGGRLKDDQPGGSYYDGVRHWLTHQHLMQRENLAIGIPSDQQDWVVDAARRQAEEIAALGVDIVGSLEHLVPSGALDENPSTVPEEAVAAVAAELLAELAIDRVTWLRAEQSEPAVPARPTAPEPPRTWRRRLFGRG
jgi:hypothetical protein